jgi:aryl carrier-like protein
LPDDIYNCDHWPVNQNGKADRKKLLEWYKQSRKVNSSWVPNDSTFEKTVYNCLLSKNKPFGAPENSLISFGWNSIDLLSLANEINLRGIFVPVAAFIQNPCIQFLLQSKTAESTQTTESLATDNDDTNDDTNYDINDILSILND